MSVEAEVVVMSEWSLVYDKYDAGREGLHEALCTLGNGYFATRGALAQEQADGVHYPGTYLAGGYNRLKTNIADHVIENEALVNFPNWLPLNFRADGGDWFHIDDVEILSFRQELDMKQGILLRDIHFKDQGGRRTMLKERRLVHMGNPHVAALELRLIPEDWSGELEVSSALDGRVINAGVDRYKQLNSKHLEPLAAEQSSEDTIFLKVQTNQSKIKVAQAARTRVFRKNEPINVSRRVVDEEGYIAHEFTIDAAEGEEIRIEKVITFYTSRDMAISECGLQAWKSIGEVDDFAGLFESHTLAWTHLWRRFHVELEHEKHEEGEYIDRVLNLHVFHLLQTISPNSMDIDTGVPSRGWHGEAYRGHILWDELFIFPILTFRVPNITRTLLMYRYRRLDEARRGARKAGFRGAMFPWQSGSSGREESQNLHLNPKSGNWIPDNSHLQRHVNGAIAYNVWRYFQVTGDKEFLSFYGGQIIVEIARFWASIASYNKELDRYEIRGVMGPDEFHDAYPDAKEPGLNNNAYTNVMAAWVLCRAREILLEVLPRDRSRELSETMNLSDEELESWKDISRKLFVPFHHDGIISQFQGYEQLEEFDWDGYRKKYKNIQRLDRILEAEGDTPNRYKVSKQADVLMLFYLFSASELQALFEHLGYPFEYETIPKNVEYYLDRTSHGSTLSRVIHSWVMARKDRERAWGLFRDALKSDIEDIQGGTTPEGIHLGAMAGTVDVVKRCFTGIEPRGDILWFNPLLPEEMRKLQLQVRYRGHTLDLQFTDEKLMVKARMVSETPIKIGHKEKTFDIKAGETKEIDLQ
ncbi:MAG: glycosyl hydrolase family 65 protein [Candidatus Zixiibacteriota bacterium]|jgi:alpha,alpha-trehalase